MGEQVDFAELKDEVGMLDVAERCGFELRSTNGMYFYGYCKMPTHGPKHSKREFSVCVPQNYWQCWSSTCSRNNGGKQGGDVINFVATFRGVSQYEAARLIVEWFGRKPDPKPEPKLAKSNTSPNLVVFRTEKKAPSSAETMPDENDAHANGEPVNPTARGEPVKPRYMQEVDVWFDALTEHPEGEALEVYWQRIRNGVKARLIQSYKNGIAAKK